MLDERDAHSSALATAPAGVAFLRSVEFLGLSPTAAVAPHRAFSLLGQAITEVAVWSPGHAETVAALRAETPRRPLARAILSEPEAAWWFGPLDRSAQLFAGATMGRTALVPPVVPSRPLNTFERYAQKPTWGLYTSTERAGLSPLLVGAIENAGDLGPVDLPARRTRLTVAPEARVVEIDGPAAWDRLCRSYPAPYWGEVTPDWAPADARARVQLVPDWRLIAGDWDGVHVSFGGLLAAEQVRAEGADGWTSLWGWDTEMTVWLRWVFTDVTHLCDLHGLPAT